jgi:hypothetical protein
MPAMNRSTYPTANAYDGPELAQKDSPVLNSRIIKANDVRCEQVHEMALAFTGSKLSPTIGVAVQPALLHSCFDATQSSHTHVQSF